MSVGIAGYARTPFARFNGPLSSLPARGRQPDDVEHVDRVARDESGLRKDWTISNGESAEKLAALYGLARDGQDAFALRSHRLAARA